LVVAFHESFWIATSAAAPVIALAAVVGLPDTAAVAQLGIHRLREPLEGPLLAAMPEALSRAQDRLVTLLFWATTVGNLIVQAGLLAVSLSALAYQRELMPAWVAIALAVGGILLLAWSTSMAVHYRRAWAESVAAVANSTDDSNGDGAAG
jgi:hypothetical protein